MLLHLLLSLFAFTVLTRGAALDQNSQSTTDSKNSFHLSPLSAIALEAEQSGLSGRIEQASRLISDLEQELNRLNSDSSVNKLNWNADQQDSLGHASQYSAESSPEVEFERQNNQVASLIQQVKALGSNMEGTIRDLNSNNRLVTAAIMKSMLNNVRRVENNLERFQNRVITLQGAAASRPIASPDAPASGSSTASNLSANVNQILAPIRDRFNKLNEEITQLMNRIRPNPAPANPSAAVQPAVTSVLKPITG